MNEVIELESIPTKIKYKGIIWIPQAVSERTNNSHTIKKPETKHIEESDINFTIPVEHHAKQSYLVKWLNDAKEVGDVFTLDEFYRKYPKHKKDVGCRKRIEKTISDLIRDEVIEQWRKDGKFKEGSFRKMK